MSSDQQVELELALQEINESEKPAIIKLVTLILNEASIAGAEAVRMHRTDSALLTEHYYDDTWHPADGPPLFIWKNIGNIFVQYAGHEYWTKGPKKGLVSRSELREDWMLETINQEQCILFHHDVDSASLNESTWRWDDNAGIEQ